MKNFLKKIGFATGFMIIGLALGVSGLAWANEGELTLEQQLSELTLTLKEVFLENPPQNQNALDLTPSPQASMSSDLPFVSCGNFFDPSGEYALTYKVSDWSMDFSLHDSAGNYLDINGDGLADFLMTDYSSSTLLSCLFLNTGRGFEPAYLCHGRYKDWNNNGTQTWRWQGDCADFG